MGYLETFAPILLIVGIVFIGAYVAPYALTAYDKITEDEEINAEK